MELEFQLTPGTEAPAEMNTWLPQYKALWMAENCTGTLHNLYTLRGAEVRDGAAWASYITEAISLYGKDAEVTFQSHNWPHWGNNVVNDYMVNTAAVYKFINDQTLTYINQGYTSDEISNMIELPEALNKIWYTRQYYGTVAHNAKAVYQKFMGWYDSNPVNLNPLMPSDSAKNGWSTWGMLTRSCKWQRRILTRVNISGSPRSQTPSSLPTRRTPMRGFCAPMHWSSWGIRQSPVRGATNI